MASEAGYEVRTGPSAGPGPVLSRPEDFGAGVGQALEQFGAVKHNAAVRAFELERQQKRASEAADFASKFAQYRAGMDTQIAQLRDTAAAGGAGHAEAVKKIYEAGRDALFAGITEDSVRRQAQVQFDESMAAATSRESLWADGKRVAKLVTDTGDLIDVGANRVRTAHDQGAYAEELKQGEAYLATLPVDEDTKAKLRQQMNQTYAVSFIQGQFDTGQAATAKGLLQAGAFDDVLDPRQKEALMNGADVEVRRAEAQAQQEQARQASALREAFATAEAASNAGQVVDPKTLGQMRDQFAALGDTSTAQKIENMIAENKFARIYEGADQATIEARRAKLAGDKNLGPDGQRELHWLQTKGDSLITQSRDDAVGYAMKYGRGPQAIDWTNPASVQARVDWARVESRATNRPVPLLSRVEADQLHERMAAGDTGRRDVLRQLDAMPPIERAMAARQVAPTDYSFQREAQLQPGYRQFVYSGRQRLQADKAFLTPDKKTHPDQVQLLAIHDYELGQALKAANAGEIDATIEVAKSYLAGTLAAQGRNANSITPADIRNAATVALGGRSLGNGQFVGGIGHWAGGQPYVVADGFTEARFELAISRHRMAEEAAGRGPVNPDGTPYNLNAAHPVVIGPGLYRWETAQGGIVRRKDGQAYVSRAEAGR